MTAPWHAPWKGRTLLVFGGAGQVGHAIASLLPPANWRVVMASRADADITVTDEVNRLVTEANPDVIVNAAAFTAVDDAEAAAEPAARVNAEGAAIVAEAALQVGAPIIHLSTDYVFDGQSDRPWIESDPVAPLSVYGVTKEAGEQAVRQTHSGHVILRTSWVFGRHGKNFVRTMLRLGAERPQLRIVADQHGCPTPAADLAIAIWRIAAQTITPTRDVFGTFHFAGYGPTTWFDFAGRIFTEAKRYGFRPPNLEPITSAAYPTPARRPAYSVLDCAKIGAIYGIVPPSWHGGLALCVADLMALDKQSPGDRSSGGRLSQQRGVAA
jgi:dTDP-4-dehydrorhamnose reductase